MNPSAALTNFFHGLPPEVPADWPILLQFVRGIANVAIPGSLTKMGLRRRRLRIAVFLSLLYQPGGVVDVHAQNWFALQGNEPVSETARLNVWGFLQPTYEQNFGGEVSSATVPSIDGRLPLFNTISPNFESLSGFVVRRARLGIRGTLPPNPQKLNYCHRKRTRAHGQAEADVLREARTAAGLSWMGWESAHGGVWSWHHGVRRVKFLDY